MNIALISPTTLVGKKEATWITLVSLAKEFKKQGNNVVILAEKGKGMPESEVEDGVEIYRAYGKGLRFKLFKKLFIPRKTVKDVKR